MVQFLPAIVHEGLVIPVPFHLRALPLQNKHRGATKMFDRSYGLPKSDAMDAYDTKLPYGGCGGEWVKGSKNYWYMGVVLPQYRKSLYHISPQLISQYEHISRYT